MTHYYARQRRNRGAWLDGLLVNQSTEVEGVTLDDLRDFDDTVQQSAQPHALVAVDQPGPARGYALLPIVDNEAVYARLHMIPDQHDEAYRALFSQARVHADMLARNAGITQTLPIRVDETTLAPYVSTRIKRLGAPYAIEINRPGETHGEERVLLNPATQETLAQILDGNLTVNGLTAEEVEAYRQAGIHQLTIHYGHPDVPSKTLLVEHGATVEQPSEPAHPGMTFDHWATNPTGQDFTEGDDGELTSNWQTFDWSEPITADVEVYAVMTLEGEPLTPEEQEQLDASGEQPPTLDETEASTPESETTVDGSTEVPVGATSDHPEGPADNEPGEDAQSDEPPTEWACPICNKPYKTEAGLEKHLDTKH